MALSKQALLAMMRDKRRLVARLRQEQNGICPLCWQPLGDDVDVDHILPKSKGGENRYRNYQLTHARCNKRKGTKSFNHEFYLSLKRQRMAQWNVVLTRTGNYRSGDLDQ